MVDGVCLTKQLNGITVNTALLEVVSSNRYGWTNYKIKKCADYKSSILIKIGNGKLKIEGSLQYLINDNSILPTCINSTKSAINFLEELLNVDLFDATVQYFEFGIAVNIPFTCAEFLTHHLSFDKMQCADYGKKGKYLQDKNRRIKLYDAALNANFKLPLQVKSVLNSNGIYFKNSNYLKFEIRYSNPYEYFGKSIKVEDLCDIDFYDFCSEDLICTYEGIRKTGFRTPSSPKELTSTTILAIALKQFEQITGIDALEIVEKFIKNSGLKPQHRYDRRNTINKAFSVLNSSDNPFDISEILIKETETVLKNGAAVEFE